MVNTKKWVVLKCVILVYFEIYRKCISSVITEVADEDINIRPSIVHHYSFTITTIQHINWNEKGLFMITLLVYIIY